MSSLDIVVRSALGRIHSTRYENPVVTKELRTRMRGYRSHWLMLGYVLMLGVFMVMVYAQEWSNYSGTVSAHSWLTERVGFKLFNMLTWCQAILILFIAPSLTAGSLTLEREQQTMEMLSLTPLSARNIIAGKVASPMLFILMLLGSSLPLAGICLMFGSISPLEIAVSYLMLIVWAFLFCSAGVFFSSVSRRTSSASFSAFVLMSIYAFITTSWAVSMRYAMMYTMGSGHDWNPVFAGLTACTAANYSLALAPVFGVRIPVALVGIVLMVSLSMLLLTTATTRLPYHKVYKPGAIRGWLLGISLTGMFLFLGNLVSSALIFYGGTGSSDFIQMMFVMLLTIITPFIPVFSTGPIRKDIPLFKALYSGRPWLKPFENRPTGGLRFLLLWCAAGCGVIILTLALNNPRVAAAGLPTIYDISRVVEVAVAILAVVFGMASIGIFLSAVCPSRQSAAVILVLFMIIAWVAFPMMMWQHEADYDYTWEGTNGVIWQAAYLWPGLMIGQLGGGWKPGQTGPELWLPRSMMSVGCLIAWSAVAILALAIASSRLHKPGGVPEE